MEPAPYDADTRCSFCGKGPREIGMMIQVQNPGSDARICNECLCRGMRLLADSDLDFDALVASAKVEPTQEVASTDNISTYTDIDSVIERWIDQHELTLHRQWVGEARFWYTSRGRECFQISIDRPNQDCVTVHAWAVDTDDDAELHGEWTVVKDALEGALSAATKLIDLWAERARMSR